MIDRRQTFNGENSAPDPGIDANVSHRPGRSAAQLARLAVRETVAPSQYRLFGTSGRMAARPTRVDIEIADRCCLRCGMCDIWKHDGDGELSINDWIQTLGALKQWLGTFRLTITGGEPFMKKGIWRLLEYVANIGIPTALITNGYMFNTATLDRLARLPLAQVAFSVDSLEATTHDGIRGVPGSLDRTLDAIDGLASRRPRFLLASSTVVVEANIRNLADIAVGMARRGCERIFFQPVQGGFTDDDGSNWPYDSPLWPRSAADVEVSIDELLQAQADGVPIANTPAELESFREYLKAGDSWVRPWDCTVNYSTFHCDAYGEVRMCIPYAGAIGNVRTASPPAIWEGTLADRERTVVAGCTKPCLLTCNRTYSLTEKVQIGHRLLRHWADGSADG